MIRADIGEARHTKFFDESLSRSGVREEKLLTFGSVARYRLLTVGRENSIDELMARNFFDVRMFGGIDKLHAELIESADASEIFQTAKATRNFK